MGKPRPRPQSRGQRGDGATPVLSHPPLPRQDAPRQPHPRPGQGAPPSRHPPALRGRGNQDLEGERRASGLRSGAAGRRGGRSPTQPGAEDNRAAGPPGQRRLFLEAAPSQPLIYPHLPSVHLLSALLSRPPPSGAVGRKEGSRARPPGLCHCPAPPPHPGWGSLPGLTRPHPLGHAYSAASPRGQSFSLVLCVSVSPSAKDPARMSTCFFKEGEGAGTRPHSSSR